MNSKALQYFMGQNNIITTLNYYAYATFDSAQAKFFKTGSLKEKRGFTTSLLPFKAKIQADLREYVSIFHT